MRERIFGCAVATAVVVAVFSQTGVVVGSQDPQAGALPRTSDGRPDLSGFWQAMSTAAYDLQDHSAQEGIPAGQGVVEGNTIPYQPAAAEQKRQNFANRMTADPLRQCYLPGVPRSMYLPFPFQIVQTLTQVSILFEYAHGVRNIFVDGSEHPEGHIDWWMGDSRGHWEGDTLVVDVTHFDSQSWLDEAGNFHSDALHLVERYTFIDPDHINYEVTIEDPKVFTEPWTMSLVLYRRIENNFQLLEYECHAFGDGIP